MHLSDWLQCIASSPDLSKEACCQPWIHAPTFSDTNLSAVILMLLSLVIMPIQSIHFISYEPCAIGTSVPACTVLITGKRESGTYNQALEAKACSRFRTSLPVHTLSTSRSLPLSTELEEKSSVRQTVFWHAEYMSQPAQPMKRD
ncbi:hypothetical protein CSKR_105240 [Clonorchis sinensis]|uniref:Uncharacterized protein n=1 Tax=Clonorchis sinensis TaxID=79923 RepID=A0A3R7ER62_CLOSI|nr:hypothetical protein CSKR_105240 [Clonorchis sinensis]